MGLFLLMPAIAGAALPAVARPLHDFTLSLVGRVEAVTTDAGLRHLYGTKMFYELNFSGTRVSDEGFRDCRRKIPGLCAYSSRITVGR